MVSPDSVRGRIAPSPRGGGLLGHLPPMRRDPLDFLLRTMRDHGDLVRVRLVHQRAFLVFHPDHIRHVLQDNHTNYTKQTFAYARLRSIFGDSLTTTDGAFWFRQRRLIQPGFHRERVSVYLGDFVRAAAELREKWGALAKLEQPTDVADDMMHLSLSCVAKSLLGTDPDEERVRLSGAIREVLSLTADRIRSVVTLSFLPTPANRRFSSAIATVDEITYAAIKRRRETAQEGTDMLRALVDARDEETGERMTDAQIRNEFLTLLIAGYETTSNALTWSWHCLSRHRDVDALLADELRHVLGDGLPTFDDLQRLSVTRRTVNEVMRLFPPTWIMNRVAENADQLGGYAIPARSVLFMAPYATHRHPAFWEDPEQFDIARFDEEVEKQRHRFAFVPFGGGPHVCIGKPFALALAHTVLAVLARRFRMESVPGHSTAFDPSISLRPLHGLKMIPRPREP